MDKGQKVIMWVVIGVVVLGFGIWYFLIRPGQIAAATTNLCPDGVTPIPATGCTGAQLIPPAGSTTATSMVPNPPTTAASVTNSYQNVWNWGPVAGATGYKYNTVNNYASATDSAGATTFTQLLLSPGTTYTLYVWAYNTYGNSVPLTLAVTTPAQACPIKSSTSVYDLWNQSIICAKTQIAASGWNNVVTQKALDYVSSLDYATNTAHMNGVSSNANNDNIPLQQEITKDAYAYAIAH